jgi:DNA adenine methylase
MKLRPILPWPGGKTRMAKHLLPLIPAHECYVEPFCGALGLFLQKPASPREVINDNNSELIGLFRSVKYHCSELLRELEFSLNSRAQFNDHLQQRGLTEIQRAARFFLRVKCDFRCGSESFAVSRSPGGAPNASLRAKMADIAALHARFDRVVIECQDWQRVVKNHDAPGTFFFFDPPYTAFDCDAYAPFTDADVAAMARVVSALAGSWLLTINDTPAHRKLFARFKQKAVGRQRGIANKKADERALYRELIVWKQRKSLQ